jgi:SAM-dependent methyltransferase
MGLTPARHRGVEILDDPSTPPDVRRRAMADVVRANALFGGKQSTLRAFHLVLPTLPANAMLLDVGTGLGDIAFAAAETARGRGVTLDIIGLDVSENLLRLAQGRMSGATVGDAMTLPFAAASVDIVHCSQLLHHFADRDAITVLQELHRVSRGWVIVSDLRRSWIAAGAFWLASMALRFHPVTRRDGVTSVLRGFTTAELERLIVMATGARPQVRRGAFWRISASWRTHAD